MRVAVIAADSSFLEDDVVLQSLGPLDEALHSGVTHIRLTFMVTCCGHPTFTVQIHIQESHYQLLIVPATLTGDESLSLTAAREVRQRAVHMTNPHLSANQVGHCGMEDFIFFNVAFSQVWQQTRHG